VTAHENDRHNPALGRSDVPILLGAGRGDLKEAAKDEEWHVEL
jgi:hypothetical protein